MEYPHHSAISCGINAGFSIHLNRGLQKATGGAKTTQQHMMEKLSQIELLEKNNPMLSQWSDQSNPTATPDLVRKGPNCVTLRTTVNSLNGGTSED